MHQVLRRLRLVERPQQHHAALSFGKQRTADGALLSMVQEGLPELAWKLRQRDAPSRAWGDGIDVGVVQSFGQQGLELAAAQSVMWILVHCSPASYYEKVIAQVPFFRG